MLSLRLSRTGKSNHAHFRLIVQERTRNPRSRALEILGHVHPHQKQKSLNTERIRHWLSVGANPSATVHNLLVSEGILTGAKKRTLPKKKITEQPATPEAVETPTTETPAA